MKRTLTLVAFSVLVGTAVLPAAGAIRLPQTPASAVLPASEATDSLSQRVDALFAEWNRHDSPGAAVAVIKDGRVVHSRGYGMANLEYDIPITAGSIFHIASISKHFTTFAVLLLEQEGKLSLDDDIRKHLPEVPDFGQRITIRHLIHHTSGLRDQWELLAMAGWRLDDVITRDHILKMVRHQRELNFTPGDESLYSNTGYTLLAEIVERVSGLPFREFTAARIFQPLGMTSTHFHDDHQRIVRNRAYSYGPAASGGFQHSPLNYANVGATSLFTTVEDLAKWDANFASAQVGGRALIEQMHLQGILNNGRRIPYAYALTIGEYRGLKTVGHGGADAGYRTYYVRFPDQQFAVIVFSNLSTFVPNRLAMQIADIYLAEHFPRVEPELRRVTAAPEQPAQVTRQELAAKVGLYANPTTDQIRRIELRNGKLTLMLGPGYELMPLDQNRFRVVNAPTPMEIYFEVPRGGGAPLRLHEFEGGEPVNYEAIRFPSPAELARFEGTYYSEELGTSYTLVLRNGRLVAVHRRHEDVLLMPTLPDRFVGNQWWFRQFRIVRDAQNEIVGFTLTSGRVRNLRFDRQAP